MVNEHAQNDHSVGIPLTGKLQDKVEQDAVFVVDVQQRRRHPSMDTQSSSVTSWSGMCVGNNEGSAHPSHPHHLLSLIHI